MVFFAALIWLIWDAFGWTGHRDGSFPLILIGIALAMVAIFMTASDSILFNKELREDFLEEHPHQYRVYRAIASPFRWAKTHRRS
jgi:hypothetical protein